MSVDLAQALQDFSSTVDFIRKTNQQIYDVYVNPTPKDVTIYGPDGQVISSVPNRAKLVAEFEDWRANVRREYPAFNILQNPWFIDTDGDGKLNSPLSVWVTSDHSVEENTVYAYNDDSLPDIVKQALLDVKAVRINTDGNLTNCCIIPFNVQKVVIKGTYDGGRGVLLPGNAVKGIVSTGALVVISTTGNIKLEGLGELNPTESTNM
jgi:hypothetical protein